jgi:enoyl-CoA hydratase
VGVSVHGSYRVMSENAIFAMPETGIGLYPDVGGSYFLPRLPGETGTYLALTGARLLPPDMAYTGIATHFVRAAEFAGIAPRLAQGESPDSVLDALSSAPGLPLLASRRTAIDDAFAGQSVESILEKLKGAAKWGRETAALLASRSPTSLKLTLREMREGRALAFDDCMQMEYRLTLRMLRGHDLYEGVRAILIDKDRQPHWHPASLAEIPDSGIDRYFAPLGERELSL